MITTPYYHFPSLSLQITGIPMLVDPSNHYDPAQDKTRLFDAAIKKVKYEGTHDYVWTLNNR